MHFVEVHLRLAAGCNSVGADYGRGVVRWAAPDDLHALAVRVPWFPLRANYVSRCCRRTSPGFPFCIALAKGTSAHLWRFCRVRQLERLCKARPHNALQIRALLQGLLPGGQRATRAMDGR